MGIDEYFPIAEKFRKPIVITGFEPVDLLRGILRLVQMLENDKSTVENAYARVARLSGNPSAQALLDEVFTVIKKEWRGIGEIPASGLGIAKKYERFDAERKFGLVEEKSEMSNGCIAGDILRGAKKPAACPHFGKNLHTHESAGCANGFI